MDSGLLSTDYTFPGQLGLYHGKVRDVYDLGDYIIMIATDRISAFDHVLPRAIPYKGQVLTQLATTFLNETKELVPNWLIDSPHPQVSIGHKCEPIPIEMVIRGYLAGHAWRTYDRGGRKLCGVKMTGGLRQNDRFEEPIITPATKAMQGHDEDISKEEVLERGIVAPHIYKQMESYTRTLFTYGTRRALERGLILVDTKYEFGIKDDQVYLIDEIHTPDSSRYFYQKGYAYKQEHNLPQEQLSKEFVREWLMEHEFMGREGDVMPDMPDEFVTKVSDRYMELYELITGSKLIKASYADIESSIEKAVLNFINSIK